jgi:hypothetical protein
VSRFSRVIPPAGSGRTQRETIDLATTLREVMALACAELLAHDVEVELRAEFDCLMSADEAQIQQVVLTS